MTTCDLIASLLLYDVSIATAGDRLILDGPEGGILDDTAILREVSRRKREIIAILRRDWVAAAVALVERETIDHLDDLIETFEERAGLFEFCANLARDRSEELAYHELAEQLADAETDARVVDQTTRVHMETRYECSTPS